MTPQDALRELLARLGASNGKAVLISEEELGRWPAAAGQGDEGTEVACEGAACGQFGVSWL